MREVNRGHIAAAFTEWDRQYREDPGLFDENWQASSTAVDYGERAADFLLTLLPHVAGDADPWRIDEWNRLSDRCAIAGCDNDDADQRGPVTLRDGAIFKVCTEHWEAIFRILGDQASWERTDGSRQGNI